MKEREIKKMCISAKCGNVEKSVTFPIPADWEDWMKELSAKRAAAIEAGQTPTSDTTFEVEGLRSMGIKINIFKFGEKF